MTRGCDVQWMTAGSGIFHKEMPRPERIQRGDVVEELATAIAITTAIGLGVYK